MPAYHNRLPVHVSERSDPAPPLREFTSEEKAKAKEKVQALNDKGAALQALASKHDLVYSADHFGVVVPHPSGKRGHNKIIKSVEELEIWLTTTKEKQ